ncbi:hypothetical protein PHSY_005125 [Pseudozyma hubeiensis SY62]|uniref:Uncharacterized protein n=1 Tax=Pseudozyma hubeiensis (strain SY62) TaxID=1305764 RepID=R9P873_PSEHS|nr:hypothetical protein PHSY_005125 [Pseudozyma hubeiensis SY62]GAC97539.1 hypothetical protein PHSY_005125 [Pseudozyma hubeiensis SY62]
MTMNVIRQRRSRCRVTGASVGLRLWPTRRPLFCPLANVPSRLLTSISAIRIDLLRRRSLDVSDRRELACGHNESNVHIVT